MPKTVDLLAWISVNIIQCSLSCPRLKLACVTFCLLVGDNQCVNDFNKIDINIYIAIWYNQNQHIYSILKFLTMPGSIE